MPIDQFDLEKKLKEFKDSGWLNERKDWLLERHNFFKDFFKRENLERMQWEDMQAIGIHINALQTNNQVRLKALGKPNHPIEYYRNSLLYLVYGTDPEEERFSQFAEVKGKYKLRNFGKSSNSEIIGQAFPEKYVFFNDRDEKAIAILGVDLNYEKTDSFGKRFIKYNNAINPIIDAYKQVCGLQNPQLTIPIEVDQFFSYLFDTYLSKPSAAKPDKIKRYWLFAPGENGEKWDEFYSQSIMAIGWDELGDLNSYKDKKEISKKLQELEPTKGSKKNDAVANFDFKNSISIGDVIICKKGIRELLGWGVVASDCFYDPSRSNYKNYRKVDWQKKGNWNTDHQLVLKTLTDVTKYPSENPNFKYYYEKLLETMGETISNPQIKPIQIALNTILYGPPGTGKTYNLIEEYFPKFTDKAVTQTKEAYFDELVSNYAWWQIIGAALIGVSKSVPEIVRHDLIQSKVRTSNTKTVNANIWSKLQVHTVADCKFVNSSRSGEPKIFYKNENSTWEIREEIAKREAPEIFELYEKSLKIPEINKVEKRYEFITFHQSYSYEEFIEGIRPIIKDDASIDNEAGDGNIHYEIRDGVFKKIVQRAIANPGKDYAIFIDEINRGNISRIFGELITLIEDDKRLGNENELHARLPYSQDDFAVPKNLFVIGTMNTADRSLALIDVALRRRFNFVAVDPEPRLVPAQFRDLFMKINEQLIKECGPDQQIGHSYFMKIQNEDDLKNAMDNKVIPLLNEYFYNDTDKLRTILKESGVEIDNKNGRIVFKSYKSSNEPK